MAVYQARSTAALSLIFVTHAASAPVPLIAQTADSRDFTYFYFDAFSIWLSYEYQFANKVDQQGDSKL